MSSRGLGGIWRLRSGPAPPTSARPPGGPGRSPGIVRKFELTARNRTHALPEPRDERPEPFASRPESLAGTTGGRGHASGLPGCAPGLPESSAAGMRARVQGPGTRAGAPAPPETHPGPAAGAEGGLGHPSGKAGTARESWRVARRLRGTVRRPLRMRDSGVLGLGRSPRSHLAKAVAKRCAHPGHRTYSSRTPTLTPRHTTFNHFARCTALYQPGHSFRQFYIPSVKGNGDPVTEAVESSSRSRPPRPGGTRCTRRNGR